MKKSTDPQSLKMKLLIYFALSVFPLLSFCQDFEGIVEYEMTYFSKNAKLKVANLEKEMGTHSHVYYKNGFYKDITNSDYYALNIFRHDKSNIYYQHKNDDTLRVVSVISKEPIPLEYEIFEDAETILGVVCDKLVIKNKYGTKTYYYSSKYSQDPKFYKNYTISSKAKIAALMKAIYLKLEVESPYYNVTILAKKVIPMKLKKKEFEIPKGIPIKMEE